MNACMNWKKWFLAGTAVAVLSGLPAGATAGEVTEQNVAERIATMKTAQDHEAIAAFFMTQAAAAAEKVKEHEAMLATWKKTTAGRSLLSMTQHCESAIASYKKLQKDYEAMAAEHEQMARDAGGK